MKITSKRSLEIELPPPRKNGQFIEEIEDFLPPVPAGAPDRSSRKERP